VILDFRSHDGSQPIEADVCVIGGGAAGITIARALAGSRLRVLLLESGGLELDPDTQALYQGETAGVPYYDLDICRLRFLGGTTNHWAGWCAPLNEIDFEPRPGCRIAAGRSARPISTRGTGRPVRSAPSGRTSSTNAPGASSM
jgi:choline dehydrogenase-like flavoprotein